MDKSWIDLPTRMSREYFNGIDKFIDFAYTGRLDGAFISCPCRKCVNRYSFSREVVREHLYSNGFFKRYKNWTNHGEKYVPLHGNKDNKISTDSTTGDNMVGMISEPLKNSYTCATMENDKQIQNDPPECKNLACGHCRNAVCGQCSSQSQTSSSSIPNEITGQVREAIQEIVQRLSIEIEQRLTKEIELKLNEKFMAHLQRMEARMDLSESQERTNRSRQISDAASGHHVIEESIGDEIQDGD